MTLKIGNYDQNYFSAILKQIVDQVNDDTGSEILSSANYDKHIMPAILKQVAEAANDFYDGDDLTVLNNCDDNYLCEALQLAATKVNAGGGGGGDLPAPPDGYHYIINADGKYLVNGDGAYILADGDA
jgi:hypothetical protein